jgi:hypothetical protein
MQRPFKLFCAVCVVHRLLRLFARNGELSRLDGDGCKVAPYSFPTEASTLANKYDLSFKFN